MNVVPLVVYEGGKRRVIGEAAVYSDGRVEGKVTDGEVELSEALRTGMVFGASLGPLGLDMKEE